MAYSLEAWESTFCRYLRSFRPIGTSWARHTMQNLLDTQLSNEGLNEATHIITSIGGNDLLHNISFLQMTSKLSEVMGKDARIGKWGAR